MKRTPQKHPLPVAGTANKNSSGTDLRPPALPSQPAARLPLAGFIAGPEKQGQAIQQATSSRLLLRATAPPPLEATSSRLLLRDIATPQSLPRPCLRTIAPATDQSRFYLRVLIPSWSSRRCYFPLSERLPLGVPSPAVTPMLSSS